MEVSDACLFEGTSLGSAGRGGARSQHSALKFNCSESWVRRVKQKYREQGKTEPDQTRERTPLGSPKKNAFSKSLQTIQT